MAEAVKPNNILPQARQFLTELRAENTREWFHENKGRYDRELKRPAEIVLAEISNWLNSEMGLSPRVKLFRPQRDLRFSDDKTPYHSHLHMMWSLPDGRAWMLGISPDYATLGAGIMQFEKPQIDAYRDRVDSPAAQELVALIDAKGWRLEEPSLKRVPAPFAPDHPNAALLRRKGLIAWMDNLEEPLTKDPIACLKTAMTEFSPLIRWLEPVA